MQAVVQARSEPTPIALPEPPHRIMTRPEMAVAIAHALSDEFSRRIIISTLSKAKTVEEISSESDIPMSTAYRRVHELTQASLLLAEKIVVTTEGKRHSCYRSAMSGLEIRLESNELRAYVTLNEDVAGRLQAIWPSIRAG